MCRKQQPGVQGAPNTGDSHGCLGIEVQSPQGWEPHGSKDCLLPPTQLFAYFIPLLSPDLRDLGLSLAEGEDINPQMRCNFSKWESGGTPGTHGAAPRGH